MEENKKEPIQQDISAKRSIENPSRKFSDFKIIRVIGTGTFGKVYLGLLEGKSMAIKVLKKAQIIQMKQTDHIKAEKSILAEIEHPFIVNIIESFQDKTRLFLTFEYVQGGEIFRLLRKEGSFPNDVALFYTTEIVLALEYMHTRKIAYRDLKPENLLIANDGHLKITDFGFAKKIIDKSFTLCGTPEYLAPEIIMNCGHNHGVDWWALGVLLFEMIAGYPPFYDNNTYEIYRKISIGVFDYPPQVPLNARKLINGLIEADIDKRLGCLSNGIDDIKKHVWFRGVDWESVLIKQIPPPWVPEVRSSTDFQYFDEYPDTDNVAIEISDQQQRFFDDF